MEEQKMIEAKMIISEIKTDNTENKRHMYAQWSITKQNDQFQVQNNGKPRLYIEHYNLEYERSKGEGHNNMSRSSAETTNLCCIIYKPSTL